MSNELMVRCPLCQTLNKWHENPFRPFCSDVCKQRDLGAWANEEYRVPDEHSDGTEKKTDSSEED